MYRHSSSGVKSGSCEVRPAPRRRILCPALCQIYNCQASIGPGQGFASSDPFPVSGIGALQKLQSANLPWTDPLPDLDRQL